MIHPFLWKKLLAFLKNKECVAIGDFNQLPPVMYDGGFDFWDSEIIALNEYSNRIEELIIKEKK